MKARADIPRVSVSVWEDDGVAGSTIVSRCKFVNLTLAAADGGRGPPETFTSG